MPQPAAGEVLIRVHAAGVNGADLREREGKYPVPPGAPDIMGLEVSGEIVAVGEGCSRFQSGDQVCALLIGGGYAEYALAPEGQCMMVPQTVSLTDAAGLPEVFCTVWTNMMDRCGLEGSESVLIQGGTSGIGHAAISLARACGATVFATARTEEKCAAMRRFGAHHPINYSHQDFAEVCRTETDGRGVDVIIDIIGGDYLPKEVELLAHGGRLMIINLRGGKVAEVDFGQVHAKHLTIGARLRPRSIAENRRSAGLWKIRSGLCLHRVRSHLKPARYFGSPKLPRHTELMESSQHIGKIILTP